MTMEAEAKGGLTEDDSDTIRRTLLKQATSLHEKWGTLPKSEHTIAQRKKGEAHIFHNTSKDQTNVLNGASKLTKGLIYTPSLPTSWMCLGKVQADGGGRVEGYEGQ